MGFRLTVRVLILLGWLGLAWVGLARPGPAWAGLAPDSPLGISKMFVFFVVFISRGQAGQLGYKKKTKQKCFILADISTNKKTNMFDISRITNKHQKHKKHKSARENISFFDFLGV